MRKDFIAGGYRLPLETDGCSRSDKAGSRDDRSCKAYCCRYFHDGSWWGLEITAYDSADAEARVAKLGNLQLQGELMITIPASRPAAAWLARATCWIHNRLKL